MCGGTPPPASCPVSLQAADSIVGASLTAVKATKGRSTSAFNNIAWSLLLPLNSRQAAGIQFIEKRTRLAPLSTFSVEARHVVFM